MGKNFDDENLVGLVISQGGGGILPSIGEGGNIQGA